MIIPGYLVGMSLCLADEFVLSVGHSQGMSHLFFQSVAVPGYLGMCLCHSQVRSADCVVRKDNFNNTPKMDFQIILSESM